MEEPLSIIPKKEQECSCLSKHRACQIEPHDFERYDYILAMDNSTLANLERLCPAAHLRSNRSLHSKHKQNGDNAR